MYLQSILIIVAIIAFFVVPILYFNSLQKKRSKKQLHKLKELAGKRDLNLDFSEASPILLIGLDANSKTLLSIEGPDADQERIVELREFVSCEVHTERTEPGGGIHLISLQLGSRTKGKQQIVFYNDSLEVNPNAERRLEMAEKWKKIISANINLS